jgi:hypothetical protein
MGGNCLAQKDNARMPRPNLAAAMLAACVLPGCSPTFNWREVRAEPPGLAAMLPCKPDKASREVPMAGRKAQLQVLGCDTGGATFALLFADIGDATRSSEVLTQWKQATLSNMRAPAGQERPFLPPGAIALKESAQVVASGQRADGTKVESHAAYFARGSYVFQAVIYADRLEPQWAESFFSGLKFE